MKQLIIIGLITASLILSACSKQQNKEAVIHPSHGITATDECHLCGMLISHFSGPKAQLFKNGVNQEESKKVHKFCSTRDMFSFYLDPENKRNVTTMYVHDMSKSPWSEPNDNYFIDAKTAWFVAGSSQKGAMGDTLASFSEQQDAQVFADKFGGKILTFEQIDLSILM